MALSKLEHHILRGFWDDGLIDLFAGFSLLLIGLGWHFDVVPIAAAGPAILVPLWAPIRARVTLPRAGFVGFGDNTRTLVGRGMRTVLGLGVATFVLAVVVYFFARGGSLGTGRTAIAGLPALLLALMGVLAWASFKIPRLPIYSAVLAIAAVVTVLVGAGPAPAMLAGGVATTLGGALQLASFLRNTAPGAEVPE